MEVAIDWLARPRVTDRVAARCAAARANGVASGHVNALIQGRGTPAAPHRAAVWLTQLRVCRTFVDALLHVCFVQVLCDECLHRPIMTHADAPRVFLWRGFLLQKRNAISGSLFALDAGLILSFPNFSDSVYFW